MKFEAGIYDNIPYEDYAAIPAYRSHDLTAVIKCPYTWKFKKQVEQTPSMLEGRVQHTLFLEEHNFDKEFVVQPQIDRRTKAGKAEYEDFLASVGDRSVVTQDLYDACQQRVEVLDAFRPQAKDSTEVSIVFDYYGNRCKARFDMIQNNVIVDLKTCRDASPKGFKQAIKSYGYHQQAAFYLDAAACAGMTEVDRFHFLAISKQHPYPYAVYELSDEAIEYGRALNEKAIDQMKLCEDTGIYTPFNLHNKIIEIGISDL